MKKILLAGLLAVSTWVASAQNCAFTPDVTPLNEVAIVGDDVTFTVNITDGIGPFSIYWWSNGKLLSPLTGDNRTITLNNVTKADDGFVFAVVTELGEACNAKLTAARLFVLTPGAARKAGLFSAELAWMTD